MLKFPHKKGDEVIIYNDWQTQSEALGTARLIRKYKSGSTFILKEMLPESSQIVYNYEEWVVQMPSRKLSKVEGIIKIRYLYNIGLTPSEQVGDIDGPTTKLAPDTFISFNGKEIY